LITSKTMSKVLVAIKRVIDYNARVRVKPDKARSALAGLHTSPTATTAADMAGACVCCFKLSQQLPRFDAAEWG
jgi:hypothetical protein